MTRKWLCAVLVIPVLTGCSSGVTGTAEQICRSWEPIRPSRKDMLTSGTKEQIAGNNAANEQWCPKPAQKVASNG